MNNQNYTGALWYPYVQSDGYKVIVIGTGGTGSFLVPLLARSSVKNIHVYDGDIFESKNSGSQNIPVNYEGYNKAKSVAHYTSFQLPYSNVFAHDKYIDRTDMRGIVLNEQDKDIIIFMCADSMRIRKELFDVFSHYSGENRAVHVFDSRLSFNAIEILHYGCNKDKKMNVDYYATKLDDLDQSQPACNLNQSPLVNNLAACYLQNAFQNWAANMLHPDFPPAYATKHAYYTTDNMNLHEYCDIN